jgi:hypothetical protein
MCSSYSLLKTAWTLHRDGRVHRQWDAPVLQDVYLEGFDATKGFYDLDLQVLADASCLNANRPRLRVVTSRDNDSFCAGGRPDFQVMSALLKKPKKLNSAFPIILRMGGIFAEHTGQNRGLCHRRIPSSTDVAQNRVPVIVKVSVSIRVPLAL